MVRIFRKVVLLLKRKVKYKKNQPNFKKVNRHILTWNIFLLLFERQLTWSSLIRNVKKMFIHNVLLKKPTDLSLTDNFIDFIKKERINDE